MDSSSDCSVIALRIEPIEEVVRRRPSQIPIPNPINKATRPTTMATQIGAPPVPLVVVVEGNVEVAVVATGVGVVTALALTVNTKAPWSGSPSFAETVIHLT